MPKPPPSPPLLLAAALPPWYRPGRLASWRRLSQTPRAAKALKPKTRTINIITH